MAKRMPTHAFQPELPSGRPKIILLDGARMEAPVCDMAGEDPVASCLAALCFPDQEKIGETRIKRKLILRAFSFHPADFPFTELNFTIMVRWSKSTRLQRRARISPTRSPVHMATNAIVRYGSGSAEIRAQH